jgi:putative phosphoesterase
MILSDTHGNYPLAVRLVSEAGPVDLIIHLGDEFEDGTLVGQFCQLPVLAVPGNCDPGSSEPRTKIVKLGGKTLLLTHGDSYGVKSGLTNLIKKAHAEQADIVLFGHTHQSLVRQADGVLLVNPGTLQQRAPRLSYAILELTEAAASAAIVTLNPD